MEKRARAHLKKCYQQNIFTNPTHLIYMYKQNSALNNFQWLIYHETQSTKPGLGIK